MELFIIYLSKLVLSEELTATRKSFPDYVRQIENRCAMKDKEKSICYSNFIMITTALFVAVSKLASETITFTIAQHLL